MMYTNYGYINAEGKLITATDYEGGVLNPTSDVLLSHGFKRIVYSVGNDGLTEDDNYIYVQTPLQPPVSASELRKAAYNSEKCIDWEGVLLSCNEAILAINAYNLIGEIAREIALKDKWQEQVERIKIMYQ